MIDILTYALFAIGIFLLIKSADWIIDSSSSIAKKLRVPKIIIGLTIVAFGTSLPELVVNVIAAIQNSPELIFGNIIGSNIANVLLIIGIAAIITNVKVKSETVWRELPFAMLSAFVLFSLVSKIFITQEKFLYWSDGIVLISLFLIFLYYIYQSTVNDPKRIQLVEKIDETEKSWKIATKLILGLTGIYFAGNWIVNGAATMAMQFRISEFLISSTIIAVGTSLPELAVSIMAAAKKNVDLAIGNAIGSNIFNILWVIGIIPFIRPIAIPSFIIVDIAIMFSSMLLLFVFMFIGKKHELTRKDGITFVILYILYILFLISRG